MERYSGIDRQKIRKLASKTGEFESIRTDLGDPDEEHDGVAFWHDGDDFHTEFPNVYGQTEALYITPSYIEYIGNDNKIKKTYDLDKSSLAREAQRLFADLKVNKNVREKLNLIFIRIGHEQ